MQGSFINEKTEAENPKTQRKYCPASTGMTLSTTCILGDKVIKNIASSSVSNQLFVAIRLT